jgi:hypothetical protein
MIHPLCFTLGRLASLSSRAREIKEELEERLEDEEGGAPEGVVPEGFQRQSGESYSSVTQLSLVCHLHVIQTCQVSHPLLTGP